MLLGRQVIQKYLSFIKTPDRRILKTLTNETTLIKDSQFPISTKIMSQGVSPYTFFKTFFRLISFRRFKIFVCNNSQRKEQKWYNGLISWLQNLQYFFSILSSIVQPDKYLVFNLFHQFPPVE